MGLFSPFKKAVSSIKKPIKKVQSLPKKATSQISGVQKKLTGTAKKALGYGSTAAAPVKQVEAMPAQAPVSAVKPYSPPMSRADLKKAILGGTL